MLKFYCETPQDITRIYSREVIDRVVAQGFGCADPGVWCADRVLVLCLNDDAVLGVATLDEFDYQFDTKGARLWLESLTLPPHPLKTHISLFSLFWNFVGECVASDFAHVPQDRVCLLVDHAAPHAARLTTVYAKRGFEVESPCVCVGNHTYTLMRRAAAPWSFST